MFAAGQKYLFESILGIRQEEGMFILSPNRIVELKYAYGKVCVDRGNFVEVRIKQRKKDTLVIVKKGEKSKVRLLIDGERKILEKHSIRLYLNHDKIGE